MSQVSQKLKVFPLLGVCAVVSLHAGCGRGGDAKDVATAINNPNAAIAGVDNQLAAAFPSGLTLSAFPQSATAAALTDDEFSLNEEVVAETSMKAKTEEQKKILNGDGDCIPKALKGDKKGDAETCYEFDQDMIFTPAIGNRPQRGTKDGKSAKGEACMVSFARSKILDVVDIVDKNTGMVTSMMCLAKKAGKATLPAVDAELDLKEAMSNGMGNAASNIKAAKIKRLADVDGRPVYRTDIELTDKGGRARSIHMIHSPAADGTNTTFDGTMWGTSADAPPPGGQAMQNDPNNSSNKLRGMSIIYKRTVDSAGKPRMIYELRSASMLKTTLEKAEGSTGAGFSAEGVLDLNAGANASGDFQLAEDELAFDLNNPPPPGNVPQGQNANSFSHNTTYIAFDVNPETNQGTMSYWQNPGGSYAETARGMVFKLDADADGKLSGCASSGGAFGTGQASYSIRKALKEGKPELLTPNGFFHPFHNTNPGNNCQSGTIQEKLDGSLTYYTCTRQDGQGALTWYKPNIDSTASSTFVKEQVGAIITQQCFKQDAAGAYVIDTAKTTTAAGFELLDTGNAVDKSKVLQPPKLDNVKPVAAKK